MFGAHAVLSLLLFCFFPPKLDSLTLFICAVALSSLAPSRANKYFQNAKYPSATEKLIAYWPTPAQVRVLMAAAPPLPPPASLPASAGSPASASTASRSSASAAPPSVGLGIVPDHIEAQQWADSKASRNSNSLPLHDEVSWADADSFYTHPYDPSEIDFAEQEYDYVSTQPEVPAAKSTAASVLPSDAPILSSYDCGRSMYNDVPGPSASVDATIDQLAVSLASLLPAESSAHFQRAARQFSSTDTAHAPLPSASASASSAALTHPTERRPVQPQMIVLPSATELTPQIAAAAAAAASQSSSLSPASFAFSPSAAAQISAHLQQRHEHLTDSAVARGTLTQSSMNVDRASFSFRIMSKLGWVAGQPLGRSKGLGVLADGNGVLPSQLAFLYESPCTLRALVAWLNYLISLALSIFI